MPGAVRSRPVKVLVIGAGQVGTAVVAALHGAHDVTVLELDPDRLSSISYRFDVLPVQGSGTARADLLRAGARVTDLVIAATDRDETNIVAAMLIRSICGGKIVVRTRSSEYFDAWRAGHLDVDFIVSSEQETAQAVARAIGYPNAVQTDVFAGGTGRDGRVRRRPHRLRRARRSHPGGGERSRPTAWSRRSSGPTG